MLSNKSQYILSKIGIPLFRNTKNSFANDESIIHFFQKDNILTLHSNSVDEYSEKEIILLEAIISSIKGLDEPTSKGSMTVSSFQPLELNQFSNSKSLKVIIIFSDTIKCHELQNPIISPTLQEMISDPNLKKLLWKKLKNLQSS